MKTILVVEDERAIARVVRDYLEAGGFRVLLAGDARTGLTELRSSRPDLVVLDLGLPDRDGLDVARDIRSFSSTPIIVLTARGDEADRIVGLELGADDYVVKPFSPKELVSRVRAVLRRTDTPQTTPEIVRAGGLEIDVPKMRVATANGTTVDLTATEFGLLLTLARAPGRVFTRGQLLEAVRGVSFESYERAIDAHIKNLRRKLESAQGTARCIETVYGVGYRFADT